MNDATKAIAAYHMIEKAKELLSGGEDKNLLDACRLVENMARSIGKDCQIIFTDKQVSVAPLWWAGEATGKTLYEALIEARRVE